MNVLVFLILVGLAASDTLHAEPGLNMEPDDDDILSLICALKNTKLENMWDCVKAIPGQLIDVVSKCYGLDMQITGVDGFRKALDEVCKIKPNSETAMECIFQEIDSNATLKKLGSEYNDEIRAAMDCLDKVIDKTSVTNKEIEE